MKVLYAIQGTGNGHISRARDVIPALQKYCETDILISGYQADVKLPFPVHHTYRGLSFIFGKKGGVDIWNTYVEANTKLLRKEIKSCPVENYDFVINDFEPVSAYACYQKKIPCVALSHQAAVLDKNAPSPKKQDLFGKFVLKNYAPSNIQFGIHFGRYSNNIFTPVIRNEIRQITPTNKGHYTVYLPSYDDEKLLNIFKQFKSVKWQVFSKHTKSTTIDKNVEIYPISNEGFIQSMGRCQGVLCGAGFEAPAEAMFLGKKLMVIPMKSQYEQQCNAAALQSMGVPVIKKLKKKNIEKINNWLDSDYKVEVDYPDITESMIKQIFENHVQDILKKNNWSTDFSLKYESEEKNPPKEEKKQAKKKLAATHSH